MATIKKVIMLRRESEARAKAEEMLRAVTDSRAVVEQKTAVQVERKLHTQQLRFGSLMKKIEAQVNEDIAKANAQLQELLKKVSSYKTEVEQQKDKLIEAREKLKAEKAAKIKAYEDLRIERRQRRDAQARLADNIAEARTQAVAKSIGYKVQTRTRTLRADLINDYQSFYQPPVHPRHLKRKIALLSGLTIITVVILAVIVGELPFADESGFELSGEPVLATTSPVSDIAVERPLENNSAGLMRGSIGGPITSTSKPVREPKIEDEGELKVKEEKSIIASGNQPTVKEERKFPKIITSANSYIVKSSDNDRWETSIGSHVSYAFNEVFIPADATIKSVVVFIEHFEEERFIEGKLEWSVGTGWPNKPEVWAAISAPIHRGEFNENVDSWDVTGVVDTVEKLKTLQLHVKNNSHSYKSKTLMDYAYVVVEYD